MMISIGGLKALRLSALLVWIFNIRTVFSITLNLTSTESIKAALQTCASGMLQNYTGEISGILGSPYSWSTAATVFGSLVDYWYYTGDNSFINITMDALLNQAGEGYKFIPTDGVQGDSSDQALWGLVVMSAAEYGFPAPPTGKPPWASMANAVFEDQVSHWDTSSCGGGLSYQVFGDPVIPGLKVSFSNARFGSLAARLGAYTGNVTYIDWANKTWDWAVDVGLVDDRYHCYLNASSATNCSAADHIEWSAVSGTYLTIAATMLNSTGQDTWKDRVDGILNNSLSFFHNGIMNEVACEGNGTCDLEQRTYKGQFARSLAITAKVVPFTVGLIMPYLQSSARGAAAQCVGGLQGNLCGFLWNTTYDGTAGPGQQMSALQVFQANLVSTVGAPLKGSLSTSNGSTSNSSTSSGFTSSSSTSAAQTSPPVNSTAKLSKGSIAGIVIGSVLGVAIATGIIFFFSFGQKHSTDGKVNSHSDAWFKPELDGNTKTSKLYELEGIQRQELPDNQLPGELGAPRISSEHPIPRDEVEHVLNGMETARGEISNNG